MDTIPSDLDFAVAYLDDILMNSPSVEQQKERVRKVFSRIQEYGLKLKEFKCDFFMEKIKYLGHIIYKDGKRPVSSLQSFLGLANYYQVFYT